MPKRQPFAVTYEIVTPESAADGDVEEHGYVVESCDLAEAMEEVGGVCYDSADGRWFANVEYNVDYQTGAYESRSLHMPDNATPASCARVARLLLPTRVQR